MTSPTAHILIASDFEEASLVTCVSCMNDQGLEVNVVTAAQRSVRGRHRLWVQGDLTYERALRRRPAELVVILGGAASVQRLLADPRTDRLLARAAEHGSLIAATRDGLGTLIQALPRDLIKAPTWISQGSGTLSDFVQLLIERVFAQGQADLRISRATPAPPALR